MSSEQHILACIDGSAVTELLRGTWIQVARSMNLQAHTPRQPWSALSAGYDAVMSGDIFSATAVATNWLTEIPSSSASSLEIAIE